MWYFQLQNASTTTYTHKVGSRERRVYANLSSTLEVERVFPIDPQLKKNSSKQFGKRINDSEGDMAKYYRKHDKVF